MEREEILDRVFETDTIPGGRYPSSVTAGLILKVLKYLEKQDRTHPGNQRGVPTKMQSIERQIAQLDDQAKALQADLDDPNSPNDSNKVFNQFNAILDKKQALEKEVLAVSQAVFLNKLEKQIQTNSVQEDHYDEPASDYESEMLDNQVAFIKYAADEICNHVHKGGVFPEWFQNKFSGVHEKIKTLHAYMEGERQQAKEKERMVSMKDAKDDYFESLESKLSEAKGLCSECGKPSWTTLNMTEDQIEEGEQHGNSKIYDKCWKGYRKVPGKKAGEKGSCKKI